MNKLYYFDNIIIFLTESGKAGLAIGKGGANIKKLKSALKLDIKVMEFAKDPEALAKNFLFPLKPIH